MEHETIEKDITPKQPVGFIGGNIKSAMLRTRLTIVIRDPKHEAARNAMVLDRKIPASTRHLLAK